jgi:hypothetical protein
VSENNTTPPEPCRFRWNGDDHTHCPRCGGTNIDPMPIPRPNSVALAEDRERVVPSASEGDRDINSTTAEQKIVEALATYTWRSGHQLCELTGLGPGTLYPALMALEKRGQIISRWEDMPPPRRRRYSLEYANHG